MFKFKLGFFYKNTCDYCGKNFRTLEKLMQHFQITHDNKTYECKKCNIKLEGMEVMRDHIRKNHSYKKEHDSLDSVN